MAIKKKKIPSPNTSQRLLDGRDLVDGKGFVEEGGVILKLARGESP